MTFDFSTDCQPFSNVTTTGCDTIRHGASDALAFEQIASFASAGLVLVWKVVEIAVRLFRRLHKPQGYSELAKETGTELSPPSSPRSAPAAPKEDWLVTVDRNVTTCALFIFVGAQAIFFTQSRGHIDAIDCAEAGTYARDQCANVLGNVKRDITG